MKRAQRTTMNPKLFAVLPHEVARDAPPAHKHLSEISSDRSQELKLKQAIDRAVSVLDRLDARAKTFAREIAQLQKRKAVALARVERLEEAILKRMDAASLTFAPGFSRELLVKPCPASVVIDDVTLIPDEYMRQPKTPPKEPDKIAIREAIDKEIEIAGAHLAINMSLVRK